ncbi:MAG: DGQHR domain-containing protein [Acidobacteriota bacterium]|nr:DGQHR domain-containing protein [Acidobacteriota bacterium]
MSQNNYVSFSCIQVQQPIGTFYIGTIDAKDLVDISYADVRRIEERDIEKILGIQRPLVDQRVKEIKEYVHTVDASFPTSIIIAIPSEHAEFDEDNLVMNVTRDKDVAKIIDGQHRIAGLEGYEGIFHLNVTVFVDMDIEDQAMVFATINLKQTKVGKSLAYDLYEYTKGRSPQKTCHNIVKFLNSRDESPFKNKIKILGTATGKAEESITQAAFVERLLSYICANQIEALKDRDLIQRNIKPRRATEAESRKLIFRNMFLDNKDAEITKIIWNYFKAVEWKWPRAWREVVRGNILNKTTGFGALMKFLRAAYLSEAEPGELVSVGQFQSIFKKVHLTEADFTPDNYKPGAGGESQLYKDLLQESGIGDITASRLF